MADLKNMLIGTAILVIIIGGAFWGSSNWLSQGGSSATVDSTGVNVSRATNYFNDWSTQTSTALSNSAAIPYLGNFFVLATGAYQGGVFLAGFPNAVAIPTAGELLRVLPFPVWLVGGVTIIILMTVILYVMGFLKGSPA